MASRQLYDHNTEVCLILKKELADRLFKAMDLPMIMPLTQSDKMAIKGQLQKVLAR